MRRLLAILGAALLVTRCSEAGAPFATTPATTSHTTPPAASVSPPVGPSGSSLAPATDAPTAAATASDGAEPVGDSWVEAGILIEGRSITQLVVLDETDEVMAVGADVACGLESEASDTTELYDMNTGRWQPGPRMPSGRHGPAVATLPVMSITGDRVLVTGGSSQEYVAKSGTVLYDPNARTWSQSGLLNTARIDPAIAVVSGGACWSRAGC